MSKLAFLFPGQGSQSVGMARNLAEHHAKARAVVEAADAALGESLSKIMWEGPDEELRRTRNTQPAIVTASVAAWGALQDALPKKPDFVVGHSLGEYSALVAAGALAFDDAVRLVRLRGSLMQSAVPEGVGAMAAVLGSDAATIDEVCRSVSDLAAGKLVSVANFNGPEQTVIAGHAAGVEAATAPLKERGAKRLISLPVSAPFHCALMQPVQDPLSAALREAAWQNAQIPVVTNVEATPETQAAALCELLVEQVVAPVRFTSSIQYLLEQGVDTFVEIGPGKTLIGIVKRMNKAAKFYNIEDMASLEATVQALSL